MTLEDTARTTVRLPRALHQLLKETAARRNTTSEALIQVALQRELAPGPDSPASGQFFYDSGAVELYRSIEGALREFRLRKGAALRDDRSPFDYHGGMSAELAHEFLQSLPTPIVIKDKDAKIVWCNFAYEDDFGIPLVELQGKTITELGFLGAQRQRIEIDIQSVIDTHNPGEFLEPMTIPNRGDLLVRAQRFTFQDPRNGFHYLGDISFEWRRIEQRESRPATPVSDRMTRTKVDSDVMDLFVYFLECSPTAIAIKDPEARLIWCNDVFLRVAGAKNIDEIRGKTSKQIWGFTDGHPIIENDAQVASKQLSIYAKEELPGWPPRTSLRFPIFSSDSSVKFLGVVSAEFQLSVNMYSKLPLL